MYAYPESNKLYKSFQNANQNVLMQISCEIWLFIDQ